MAGQIYLLCLHHFTLKTVDKTRMRSVEHLKLGIQKDPELYIDEFENHIQYVINLLAVESYAELQSSLNLVHHCLSGMFNKVDLSVILSLLFKNIASFNNTLRMTTVQLFIKYCRVAFQRGFVKNALPQEIGQANPIVWYWDWSFNTLLKLSDKPLRKYLLNVMVTDISNHKQFESQFLRIVQPFLDAELLDSIKDFSSDWINPCKYALRLLMQGVHSKRFTTNLSTHLLTTCVFHPVVSVAMSSTQFLLKPSKLFASKVQEDDEEDDEMVNRNLLKQQTNELKRLNHLMHVSKGATRKSGIKSEQRLKKSIKKHQKLLGKDQENDYVSESHTLIRLLSNPYEFYDKVYKLCMVSSGATRLTAKHRDLKLRLVARCIYVHKLNCQQYYTLLLRWMHPHLPSCPNTLHCMMESIHDQVPTEWIKPCVRAIADRFVVEAQGDDRMAVGLGVIKSICERNPNVFSTESFDDLTKTETQFSKELAGPDLLTDLCLYTKYKGKAVVSASRALLNFYREANPELLPQNMRGRTRKDQSDDEEMQSESGVEDSDGSEVSVEQNFDEFGPLVEIEENVEATFYVDAITAEDQEALSKRVKDKHSHSHTRKQKAAGASLSEAQKRKKKNTMMLLHGGKLGKGGKKRKMK
eukprot:NODE_406_length_9252_cov_0.363269.p2 type:complete len:640 gc:universal NODE_406_length_9252_cov_0.363269:1029-2948(+)